MNDDNKNVKVPHIDVDSSMAQEAQDAFNRLKKTGVMILTRDVNIIEAAFKRLDDYETAHKIGALKITPDDKFNPNPDKRNDFSERELHKGDFIRTKYGESAIIKNIGGNYNRIIVTLDEHITHDEGGSRNTFIRLEDLKNIIISAHSKPTNEKSMQVFLNSGSASEQTDIHKMLIDAGFAINKQESEKLLNDCGFIQTKKEVKTMTDFEKIKEQLMNAAECESKNHIELHYNDETNTVRGYYYTDKGLELTKPLTDEFQMTDKLEDALLELADELNIFHSGF